jgi:ubiquinone/menaquinone biosynthesis C-methylase UbiE
MPGVRDHWRTGRLSATVYDAAVERERVAQAFGRLMWGTDARLLYEDIATLGEEPAGTAILDVPCGGGVALRGLRPSQAVRYVAADLSPVMLERARAEAARRGLSNVEFVDADVESLPFDDGSFDLCLTYASLHCFADPPAALKEVARVLRAGGRLRGTSAVTGAGIRQDALIRLYRRAGIFGRCGSVDEVRGWLEEAGLADVEVDRSGAVASFRAVRPSA